VFPNENIMSADHGPSSGQARNRYEEFLGSISGPVNDNASCFAAAAQQVRLEMAPKSEREAEIVDVATGVAGPVLCSYVLWVLREAVQNGLERLYFISRDGEILLKIAQILLPAFWPGWKIELRYLLGSRQAWHLPSLAVAGQEPNDWLLFFFENSSLKSIFARVELTLDDCRDRLSVHGFSVKDWERKLIRAERNAVEKLVGDPILQERIRQRAQAAMKPVLGYLEQEGLMEKVPYGLVDLGWTGRTKGSLEKMLGLRGVPPPFFFFFGRNAEKSGEESSVLRTYLFNLRHGTGSDHYMPAIEALLEVFCTSLEDGLCGYQPQDDGGYGPVYRESNKREVEAWGYQIMRDSILRFSERLATSDSQRTAPPTLSAEVSAALLKIFWLAPTPAEARVWGEFPFEEDQQGTSYNRLVPPVKWGPGTLGRLLRNGRGFDQCAVWHGGIVATNPPWMGRCWMGIYHAHKTLYALKLKVSGGQRQWRSHS